MRLSLVHPTYKISTGKKCSNWQTMHGFENIHLAYVGTGTELSLLFLMELTDIQPHHPDCTCSTAQRSLLFHVRDAVMSATMEADDKVNVPEKDNKFEVSKCERLCSSF